ncbi:aminotransferase class I/II-fold pyridoxal phosphate-dependent enzyme [Carboxydocella sp. ULO1]|uniref:aminotransferase class I/II-fold pyridoxal phosphate-dependent enzyme n=1 Tax=Carboxydocella sp. ULO1 TaxID=1926599 RepID=UPI0009AC38AC|nr:aminotransferase class I/II-fold pyridoxal phosphate-dependent enzyme [Carboxydocella sp. ULO1]
MAQLRAYGKIKIMNKQADCPIFDAINEYLAQKGDCWHMPGHGQGRAFQSLWPELAAVARWDVTEIPGLDSWHQPEGCIAAAEKLLAEAYQTQASFFLVEGASAGIWAMMAAVVSQNGNRIAIPRWAHASVFHALVLTGAEPVFYPPVFLPEWQLIIGPETEGVALDSDGIFFLYPSYEGVAWPLKDWMLANSYNTTAPVLVDEAHGALFPWHERMPVSAITSGCDGVVHGLHKTGPALTQTGYLHLPTTKLKADWVRKNLSLLTTTSPSYLFMAALDLARRELYFHGREKIEQMLEWAEQLRWELERIGIEVLKPEQLPAGYQLDRTRLLLRLEGYTGVEVATHLRQKGIVVEKYEADRVLLLINYDFNPEQGKRLIEALGQLKPKTGKPNCWKEQFYPEENRLVMLPREAWLAKKERVATNQAKDRVAAQTVAPCPPGLAIVCPGEVIQADTIAALEAWGIEEIWVVK